MAPATSVGTNSCFCLPQYLWGLGRQGWCPAHLWAPGGGVNEQPMNRYVLPRQTQRAQRMYPQLTGQRDPGSPPPQGSWQCPMTSSLFLRVEASSSPLFPLPWGQPGAHPRAEGGIEQVYRERVSSWTHRLPSGLACPLFPRPTWLGTRGRACLCPALGHQPLSSLAHLISVSRTCTPLPFSPGRRCF